MHCIVSLARVIASLPDCGNEFSSNLSKNAALLRLATFHLCDSLILAVGIKFAPSATQKLVLTLNP